MGYWEHNCAGCKTTHDAALWYSRSAGNKDQEYLCGEKYNQLRDKAGWVQEEAPWSPRARLQSD